MQPTRSRGVLGAARGVDPRFAIGPRRRRALRYAVLAAALLGLFPGPGRAVTQDGQVWFVGTARITFAERFKLFVEAQPRIGGDGLRQLLLRPAVGYQFLPYWALYQGYGWTPSFNPYNDENRVYQESLFDNALGGLRMVNRTRLEERFIEGVEGVSLRLRHMLRLMYPLDGKRNWFATFYDEAFVTLNDAGNGPQSGFDQNRAYIGMRRQLSKAVALELGYVYQYVNKPGDDDLSSNNAVVWVDVSL